MTLCVGIVGDRVWGSPGHPTKPRLVKGIRDVRGRLRAPLDHSVQRGSQSYGGAVEDFPTRAVRWFPTDAAGTSAHTYVSVLRSEASA